MTLKDMREQMAKLATEARSQYDDITPATDEARAKELSDRFDTIMEEYDALAAKVERQERLEVAERSIESAPDPRAPRGENVVAEARQEAEAAPEYREVFANALRFGAAALSPQERNILIDHRAQHGLSEYRAQSVGTDSAGGYTVPEGFSGEIDRAMAAWGPMLDGNVIRSYPTASGNPIPFPTVDDTAKTLELHTENGAVTDDGGMDVVFGEKVLNAFIYDSEMVKVSLELLEDSFFNVEGLMADLFGERLARGANLALTTGTGSSQPNGIVTASAAGKTAASATAITSDELIDLQHSVDPAYRQAPGCGWMFNDSTLSAIRKLKDGQSNYLWQMGDVQIGAPPTLLGKPYYVNQAMDSIATAKKTVLFGNFQKYIVRRVGDSQVITLRERYAENLQVGFVGIIRIDGELLNTGAVKHLVQA
jgi:HK97 family phage major capsid protein